MTRAVSSSACSRLARRVPAAAAAASFIAMAGIAAASFAATDPDPAPAAPATSASQARSHLERRQDWIRSRLARAAGRLEIKASQEPAWQAFAQSVEAFAVPSGGARPGRDADAAAIARYRANRASDIARKLTQVADATSKLEGVLTEDQRKVFDDMAHRYSEGRHRHRHERDWHRRHEGGLRGEAG